MGLFGGGKKLCPVCGNKASRFLPLKLNGEPLCGECEHKVFDLPSELQDGVLESMETLRAYFAVYDENLALRQRFQQTYQHDFGIIGGTICLDANNRLLRLSTSDDAFVFEPENIKLFRISEDSSPLFEGTAAGLVCYHSPFPDRVRDMGREIDRFRLERRQSEHLRHMEEEMERLAKARGEEYHTRYIPTPDVSSLNPFQKYYLHIELDHPYRKITKDFKETGPGFSDYDTSMEGYFEAYNNYTAQMRAMAEALMSVINPDAPVQEAPAEAQPSTRTAGPAASPADPVAEIQKYKALADSGVITQEEFAAKKRQLLGI